MNRYIVILDGRGEGCDYTIGCNVKVIEVQAPSDAKAVDQVEKHLQDFGKHYGEECVEKARIFRIPFESSVPFNLERLRQASHQLENIHQEAEQINKERVEYERLKRKYGD